jgi:hypothetical protein
MAKVLPREGPINLQGTKLCRVCRFYLKRESFPVDRRRPDFLYPDCRTCHSQAQKDRLNADPAKREAKRVANAAWARTEAGKASSRAATIRAKYNLEPWQWNEMFEAQGHCCKLCGRTEPFPLGTPWNTDHDHATGKLRGIVCQACNHVLGLVEAGWQMPSAERMGWFISLGT